MTILLTPNFESPVDSSEDVLERNLIPYVHPGGFIWKQRLQDSVSKANQELSEKLIIPDDYDAFFNLSEKTIQKGSYARLEIYLKKKEEDMGLWYRSRPVFQWSPSFSGFVTDKKWNLIEEK